ncbi:MAG: phosphate transport system substrate-binding protein [Acidobacteriota bacterium]|nr:phosphate transport system substrate-binding protein [Acidobacteriota bacterium]
MPLSKRIVRAPLALLLAAASLLVFGCSGQQQGGAGAGGGDIRLQGAGSTFVNPLLQKWVSEYGKLKPNVKIDYQSIGSGGGIKQIKEQTIDFGASDAPMKDDDLKSAPGEIIHIPLVLGAVVITYNLQGVAKPLRFSSDVIADIFLGNIKKWDDPRIQTDNPGVSLPSNDITVVHRSDGSGTSAVFTDYLSKVSTEWKEKVGAGTSPNWPVGIGGKGNEGVTGQVKQTPDTIGYVELAYAVKNNLPVSLIKNKSGSFVEPSLDTVSAAAAESLPTTPKDLRVSITDPSGANTYPISSYVYALVYKEQKDAAKGKALVDFLWWGIHDGEGFAKDLQYAPLPQETVKRAEAKIDLIGSGGKTLRAAQ